MGTILGLIGIAISLISAFGALWSAHGTQRARRGASRRAEFQAYRDVLTPLQAEIERLRASLQRSSEPTVPMVTLQQNYSSEYPAFAPLDAKLVETLGAIDAISAFEGGWRDNAAQILTEIENNFDLALQSDQPEAAVRAAAQSVASHLGALGRHLAAKVSEEVAEQLK